VKNGITITIIMIIRMELCHLIIRAYTLKSCAKNSYLNKNTRKIEEKCKRGNK